VELLYRPGRTLREAELAGLVAELREIAGTCFDEIPSYQCLVGTREALSDKIVTVARAPGGRAVGFCSALILPVEGVGEVLHLGLTCVRPDARSGRLTTRLLSKIVIRYFWRYRGLRRIWCSNVACVLSSLGNVALNFAEVHPSPLGPERPTDTHLRIARAIDRRHRRDIHIDPRATLDEAAFVFRRSVPRTVFQKDAHDSRFLHRDRTLNDYYRRLMSFEDGDEVVQVGYVDLRSLLAFAGRQLRSGRRRGAGPRRAVPGTTGG
jgi:hypothetical protein